MQKHFYMGWGTRGLCYQITCVLKARHLKIIALSFGWDVQSLVPCVVQLMRFQKSWTLRLLINAAVPILGTGTLLKLLGSEVTLTQLPVGFDPFLGRYDPESNRGAVMPNLGTGTIRKHIGAEFTLTQILVGLAHYWVNLTRDQIAVLPCRFWTLGHSVN